MQENKRHLSAIGNPCMQNLSLSQTIHTTHKQVWFQYFTPIILSVGVVLFNFTV